MENELDALIIERNKKLIEKYPFLLPRNRWTDKVAEDYDYSYTELDSMPDGWRIAFGDQMCADLKAALDKLKPEVAADFRITQIKEKWGSLRFYTNWVTHEIYDVIHHYEKVSENTCINCGAPAVYLSRGWVAPWCEACVSEINDDLTFL